MCRDSAAAGGGVATGAVEVVGAVLSAVAPWLRTGLRVASPAPDRVRSGLGGGPVSDSHRKERIGTGQTPRNTKFGTTNINLTTTRKGIMDRI